MGENQRVRLSYVANLTLYRALVDLLFVEPVAARWFAATENIPSDLVGKVHHVRQPCCSNTMPRLPPRK